MMSCTRRNVMVCIAACLAAGSSARAGESIDLRPHWTPGATAYIEFTWDNDDTHKGTGFPPEGQHRHVIVTYGFLHKVEDVTPAGDAKISLAIDRAAISIEGEGPEVSFDTDAPEHAKIITAYGKKLQALIGQSITMTVRHDGRVDVIEGTEQLVRQALPDESDPYEYDLAIAAFCLAFKAQTTLWRQYYGYFAFSSVSPGDTWTRRIDNNDPLDVHYTLDQVDETPEGTRAVVTHAGHMDKAADWQNAGPVLMQSGPYNASGRTVIDVDAGRVVSGRETVVQEVSTKGQDSSGRPLWHTTTNSAKHTLIVLTEAQRKASKHTTPPQDKPT